VVRFFVRLSLPVLVVLAALAALGVAAASAQSLPCSTTMSTDACDAYQGVQEFIGSLPGLRRRTCHLHPGRGGRRAGPARKRIR
jgi:hypothetical protein